MQVETLQDVLHWTVEFHQLLSSCLSRAADKHDQRGQLLLSYLADHETKLAQVVEQFEKSANPGALHTWCYEYLDKHPIIRHQHGELSFDNLTTSEIMNVIVSQHNQLIELYRYLYSRAATPSSTELLENLLQLEEHEAMRMAQGSNRLEDI